MQKQRIAPGVWLGVGLVLVGLIVKLIPTIPPVAGWLSVSVLGVLAIICFVAAARAYWWNQGYEASQVEQQLPASIEEQPKQTTAQKKSPRITALEPRVSFVAEASDGGFVEQPTTDSFLSVLLAVFRHDATTPPAEVVRAHVTYHHGDDADIHQRVNYGCWLGQEVNWAEFDASDTHALILAIGNGRTNCITIDDNRDEAGASKGTTPRPLARDPLIAVVELVVMDGNFGFVSSQEFRFILRLKDFAVTVA